jgi:hypothetical protein
MKIQLGGGFGRRSLVPLLATCTVPLNDSSRRTFLDSPVFTSAVARVRREIGDDAEMTTWFENPIELMRASGSVSDSAMLDRS